MSKHFDAVAKDWDADDFKHAMSTSIANAVKKRIPCHGEMEILDFGAGTGLLSQNFYDDVAHITAVDISEAMLEQLKQKEDTQNKLTIFCQDIMETPLNKKFDVIMSAMAMHHVENTKALLATLHTHLKPDGVLAIADLDSEDGTFHPQAMEGIYHYGFDRDSLKTLLEESKFSNVTFDTAFKISKEGKEFPIFLVTAKSV